MRMSTLTPTLDPLPYTSQHGPGSEPGTRAPELPRLPLDGAAIARFDALLHEIHPDAARVEPERLHHLLGWLMSLPSTRAHDVIDRRLRRIEELRAMFGDSAWDSPPASRARVAKLLDYVDRADDLIDDHQPLVGLLDDVLLVELAWPAFAAEAEEYRDFCAYRHEEHPDGDGGRQRAAWIRDRTAEIALLRHQWQVAHSHYAESGTLPERFHIS